jgi:hypothetical protein
MSDKTPVGEVRPSQLLWTYGPGALVDLPSLSVVTLGIDRWPKDQCMPVEEARLLAAVRRTLGPQVDSMRMPPIKEEESFGKRTAKSYIGVPVRPFPRWLRCVKCGLLSEYDTGLFELKEAYYRPEFSRFVHVGCRGSDGKQKARDADAVPARFLLACRNGHLDDFPWNYYVHRGNDPCRGTLRFFENGASLQTEDLWVKCDQCGASRNMAQAFGDEGKDNLPGCRGRNAHLDTFDSTCEEDARAVLLGATNSWFPVTISALAIPLASDPLSQLVTDDWETFEDIESQEEVGPTIKVLKKKGLLPGIEKYTNAEVWEAIERKRAGGGKEVVTDADIKGPEWKVLIDENPPTDYPHFMSSPVDPPPSYADSITQVLLLERLREVNALVGFTRVEAPETGGDDDQQAAMADLSSSKPNWVPVNQVHGEGIFLRFDEDALVSWETRKPVQGQDRKLFQGHRGWRNARKLDPDVGYPGVRYAMLHTLAHLLIRELSLECGYNAASIRERIYADVDGSDPQAGILIYTAAADSDGTLGGLVELGHPENLGRLLDQALNRARVCSSDPLCSEHDPQNDRSLHGAACHACGFVSETSCEQGNRYLDRALVVPTIETPDSSFFGS